MTSCYAQIFKNPDKWFSITKAQAFGVKVGVGGSDAAGPQKCPFAQPHN